MKKLAYHSPFLPQKSGISWYSNDLLKYLVKYYDITIISDEQIKQDLPCITYAKFDELMSDKQSAFDRNIYNMGNNCNFHASIYTYALKYPGVVILHDFSISNFMLDYHKKSLDDFLEEVYFSHGTKALFEFFLNNNASFCNNYLLNRRLLENSKNVIIHTQKALELARKFYANDDFLNLSYLPCVSVALNKQKAKEELKLENSRIYGVFGFVCEIKQNLEIIKSWARVMKDKNALLLFVGEITDDQKEYFQKIQDFIKENNIENIKFIGWADSQFYKKYLQACDICITLRKIHRGEASAALLDCFNYGNTTITNFAGFEDCTIYIPKVSDDGHELDGALLKAYDSDDSLAKKAKERIIKEHDPELYAQKIAEITEQGYAENKTLKCFKHRILVDISSVAKTDPATGISRVVFQELNALLQSTFLPVIPVNFKDGFYYSANEEIFKKFGLPNAPKDEKIIPQNGDIFYGLDFSVMYRCDPEISTEIAHQNGFFDELKKVGGKVFFRVYDLLPLSHPEFFPYHAGQLHLRWCELLKDIGASLIPISKRVAKDLENYGFKDILPVLLAPHFNPKNLVLENSKNSILENSENSKPENSKNSIPTFICVGTIEERKGIKAICLAFEKLALEKIEAKLIIIGRMGRVDDDFKDFLEQQSHENIVYKGFVSDDELLELYASSHALIAASYDEGFGLPLIESGLPVIARDIEVFKEVLEGNALYFKDTFELIKVIKDFIASGTPPLPTSAKRSYKDVASEILKIFFK